MVCYVMAAFSFEKNHQPTQEKQESPEFSKQP